MILLALLLQAQVPAQAQAQAQAQAPVLPTEEQIVVTGRRMSQMRIGLRANPRTRQTECQILRSSGDRVLDGRVCGAVNECARIHNLHPQNIVACVQGQKEQLLSTYVPGRSTSR